jgi:hypothetical protein
MPAANAADLLTEIQDATLQSLGVSPRISAPKANNHLREGRPPTPPCRLINGPQHH